MKLKSLGYKEESVINGIKQEELLKIMEKFDIVKLSNFEIIRQFY